MSELCLVTSGLWCYSKCQSQECHLGGRGMTLFTMCGAFLSKQCWVRSARWSAVMDASPGGCRNPRSEQCQTFSNEESGAVPVLQVTLEGGQCTHRSGLQSLLKPMFSEFQALSTLHFLAIKWTESDIPPAKAKQIKSPSPPFSSEKPPLLAKRQAPNFSPCQERGQAGVTESPLAASPVFCGGWGGCMVPLGTQTSASQTVWAVWARLFPCLVF